MKRAHLGWRLAVAGVAAGMVAVAAWWWLRSAGQAAPPPPAPASPVSVVDGITVVQLRPAVQRASGLQERVVGKTAGAAPVAAAYGVVMDIQPLVDWRGKFVAAQAQERAARTQWAVAQAEAERLRALHGDAQNASLKALQAAHAAAARAQADAASAGAALRVLQADALQQFGAVLAGWAQGRTGPMQRLLLHRASLVGVALGAGPAPAELQVSVGTGPRQTARWVGRAVRADPQLGAALQVYLVPSGLPANAGVIAWRSPAAGGDGVFVPLDAVVWYADQPWAYARRDASHFARLPLLHATETPDGFVAQAGIAAGASVVTQGAGLLLSVEQTPPPSAAPCKDPECDD